MPHGLDQEGRFKPESGDFDDLNPEQHGYLNMDPKTIPGTEKYRPGDIFFIRVKVKMPEDSGEGITEIPIITAKADEMDRGSSLAREKGDVGGRTVENFL